MNTAWKEIKKIKVNNIILIINEWKDNSCPLGRYSYKIATETHDDKIVNYHPLSYDKNFKIVDNTFCSFQDDLKVAMAEMKKFIEKHLMVH